VYDTCWTVGIGSWQDDKMWEGAIAGAKCTCPTTSNSQWLPRLVEQIMHYYIYYII